MATNQPYCAKRSFNDLHNEGGATNNQVTEAPNMLMAPEEQKYLNPQVSQSVITDAASWIRGERWNSNSPLWFNYQNNHDLEV